MLTDRPPSDERIRLDDHTIEAVAERVADIVGSRPQGKRLCS
jgi:hypothetical protein